MDKTPIIIIAIIILASAGIFILVSKAPQDSAVPTPMPDGIVFFYSDTCPHCKNVEDFFEQNNIQKKVPFTSIGVSTSQANAQLLIDIGVSCGLDQQNIGAIPLLWTGQSCVLGDQPIIDFFTQKIETE